MSIHRRLVAAVLLALLAVATLESRSQAACCDHDCFGLRRFIYWSTACLGGGGAPDYRKYEFQDETAYTSVSSNPSALGRNWHQQLFHPWIWPNTLTKVRIFPNGDHRCLPFAPTACLSEGVNFTGTPTAWADIDRYECIPPDYIRYCGEI